MVAQEGLPGPSGVRRSRRLVVLVDALATAPAAGGLVELAGAAAAVRAPLLYLTADRRNEPERVDIRVLVGTVAGVPIGSTVHAAGSAGDPRADRSAGTPRPDRGCHSPTVAGFHPAGWTNSGRHGSAARPIVRAAAHRP